MNPNGGLVADAIHIHIHINKSSSFGGHLVGPKAKKSPDWVACGADMIAHVDAPNMRLKLIGGKWRSISSNKKDLTRKVQSANVGDT